MTQDFTTLVLRFTDGTADEIRKASAGAAGAPDGHVRAAAEDLARGFRKDLQRKSGAAHAGGRARRRPGAASSWPPSAWAELLTGRNVLFIVDPGRHLPRLARRGGADDVERRRGASPGRPTRCSTPTRSDRGMRVQVTDEKLDVTIERSGMMKSLGGDDREGAARRRPRGAAEPVSDAARDRRLQRERSAAGFCAGGQGATIRTSRLSCRQPAKAGDTVRLLTVYSGKDALRADGNDTYYLMPGARDSWYPSGQSQFGDFANFHMTFHHPEAPADCRHRQAGEPDPEGGGMVKAVWESGAPIPVAGFNLGDFKTMGTKTPQGFSVDAYADVGLPDMYTPLAGVGHAGQSVHRAGAQERGLAGQRRHPDLLGLLRQAAVRPRRADRADAPATTARAGRCWCICPSADSGTQTVQHQLGLLDHDASYWQRGDAARGLAPVVGKPGRLQAAIATSG